MKVYIGKYRHHYTVSGIEKWWLQFNHGVDWDLVSEQNYTPADRIVIKVLDGVQWILNHTINEFNGWRGQQKIRVHVDPWDTWSADHTLAHVILPVLEQLRDTSHGYFLVDLKDVPKDLRPSREQIEHNEKTGAPDDKAIKRWRWVMDEMIFAFQCKVDDSWEDQFYDFGDDMLDTKLVDPKGLKRMDKRIQKGFELFGKYYQHLWD
jgi:hypothetical protein